MKELDKYLKYLEKLKKENISKKELKNDVEKLITKGRTLLNNLENNLVSVNEDDLKIIFEKINDVDLSKVIIQLKNIKMFSRYFNDEKFMNQPQVVVAKKNLENIERIIVNCLKALEQMITNITLHDQDKLNQQVNFVKRIKKHEQLSGEELSQFYSELMNCSDIEIDINTIIMDVTCYLNELLTKQVERKIEDKKKNNSMQVDDGSITKEIGQDHEQIKNEEAQFNDLTMEELELIDEYKKIIEEIFKISKNYHIKDFSGLKLTYQFGNGMSNLTKEVLELVGIELNYELVELLDVFNEIVTLEEDIRQLFDKEYLNKLREIIDQLGQFTEDELDVTDESILDIMNRPKSLVVFLGNRKQGQIFVEKDFKKVRGINKDVTRLAVKKIVTDFYNHHVTPCVSGDILGRYTDFRVAHAKSGRYVRSFYIDMSVSVAVKQFLKEKYNTDVVYLYTGFINIGNHESGYENEQYNRCKSNYNEIVYLNKLFSKSTLTEDDKREISGFIDEAIEITKKLNGFERKKRYE